MKNISEKTSVAVIGLGYVGLPLAIEFGKKYRTIGFDLSESKIANYRRFCDPTGQISAADFEAATKLEISSDPESLGASDIIVIAVPTPVDSVKKPDFSSLISASMTAGKYMKKGAIVIYESTVYPGATEEICTPVLEKHSGMKWRQDFHVGYSPERINPGDKERTITKIVKVVSGDDVQTLEIVAELYESIIDAGVHRAGSIKVAEAAKVIENTQRDLNIALMNELALIFSRIGIDTLEVLQAAGSKWNFHNFRPGLVGGHCIGIDSYYLTHKAEMLGYHPQVILAGRCINDSMAAWVAHQTVRLIALHCGQVKGAKVIVLGVTFKEDCPDFCNSKVADLISELKLSGCEVSVHDPIADVREAEHEFGMSRTAWHELPEQAEAIVAAVAHREYRDSPLADILAILERGGLCRRKVCL
jgi:UDP-N-acetyl-D-galactosamine dehydrogenase